MVFKITFWFTVATR